MNEYEKSPWKDMNEAQRQVEEEQQKTKEKREQEENEEQADETIFVDSGGVARRKEMDKKPNKESPWFKENKQ